MVGYVSNDVQYRHYQPSYYQRTGQVPGVEVRDQWIARLLEKHKATEDEQEYAPVCGYVLKVKPFS